MSETISGIQPASSPENTLADWRTRALRLEDEIAKAVIGQERAIRLINVAVFARGHVLLEGDVGVGKTTLLRAVARTIGGAYQRMEGTIDLMPSDLVYYTFIGADGRPRVEPGPLLKSGESLSTFFFNEVNRSRPQVHSLLLRVMAERSVTAFNREYRFPHLQVFADRNRIEKEETFELPSAARDRFLMEIAIEAPDDRATQKALMFETRFHDVDMLIETCTAGVLPFSELNDVSALINDSIQATDTLKDYALDLCEATRNPGRFGIRLVDGDIDQLIQAGISPRGMSMLMRAARIYAWLEGRESLVPEDFHRVFFETAAHRVFLRPVYELRRPEVIKDLFNQILARVSAP
ncbi:MAG: MoxR family ATPase [Gammaproteobacteria bacterium]|nr:MoxR family ATPase [Gammaproteobacteria bacterium]